MCECGKFSSTNLERGWFPVCDYLEYAWFHSETSLKAVFTVKKMELKSDFSCNR